MACLCSIIQCHIEGDTRFHYYHSLGIVSKSGWQWINVDLMGGTKGKQGKQNKQSGGRGIQVLSPLAEPPGGNNFTASRRRWPNVESMLGQRHRRWTNIDPALCQGLLFAGLSKNRPNLFVVTTQINHFWLLLLFEKRIVTGRQAQFCIGLSLFLSSRCALGWFLSQKHFLVQYARVLQ